MARMPGDMIDPDPRKLLEDDDMLQLVKERYDSSKDWVEKFAEKWEMWGNLYKCMIRVPEYTKSTAIHIPLTFSTIESFLPRMVGNRPRFDITPRTDGDMEKAQTHRQMIEYQWEHGQGQQFLTILAKSALTFGSGWGKLGWEVRYRNRTVTHMDTDEFGVSRRVTQVQKVKVYDGPTWDVVDLGNIYPDPTGSCPDTCQYVGHRFVMHMHELEDATAPVEEGGRGYSKEAVAELKRMRQSQFDEASDDSISARRKRAHDVAPSKTDLSWKFEILEYWEDDRMAVICLEPLKILLNIVNPYNHGRKPFVLLKDYEVPGELYGLGEAEVLQSINFELDELHNLRLEMAKRLLQPQYKVRMGTPITPEDLVWSQETIVWVEDMDDVQPLYTPDVKGSSYREEDGLRMWAMEATGANDVFKGLQTNMGNETATGASILAEAASSRTYLKFQNMVNQVLVPMVKMMIAMNEQFVTSDRWITVTDNPNSPMLRISPADLALGAVDLDVKIDVGETDPVNRQVKMDRLTQILGTLVQVYGDPNHPAIQTVVKRLLDLAEIPISQAEVNQPSMPPGGQPGNPEGQPAEAGPETMTPDIAALLAGAGPPGGM